MRKLTFVMAIFAVSAICSFAQVPSQIKGGILNGKATSLPKPEYPEAAKTAGLEGVVYVNVVIDEEGNIISAVADDQPRKITKVNKDGESVVEEQPVADILLRDAALRAAWNAKFSPTLLNNVPVRVTGTIVYNFVASGGEELKTDPVNTEGVDAKTTTGGLNSRAISIPAPEYPAAARAVKAQGPVRVQVTVDESGNVISAAAVSGHPLLRAASVKAAREAKFAPALLNGQPVKLSGTMTYNFVAPPEN